MKKLLYTIALTCSSFMLSADPTAEKSSVSHNRKHYLFCSASLLAGTLGARLPVTTQQHIACMRTYFLGAMTGQTAASMLYNRPTNTENAKPSTRKQCLDIAYGLYNAAFIDIARRFKCTTPKQITHFRAYALGCIASQAIGVMVKEIGAQHYATIQKKLLNNTGPTISTLSATTELY